MEITLTFLPDGSVTVVVPQQGGLTFADAVARLKKLEKELGIAGLPLTFIGEPEQHTHDPATVSSHTHQQSR